MNTPSPEAPAPMPRGRRASTVWLRRIGFFLVLALVWGGLSSLDLWPNYLFPSPLQVWESLVSGLGDGTFSIGIRASVVRLIQGYAISLVLGLTLGLLMAQTRWLKDTLA